MSNIYYIGNYELRKEDKFFFDTNIWIYVYYPLGAHRTDTIKLYDTFLKKVMLKGSRIYTSSLVLSEFINRWFKLEYRLQKDSTGQSNLKYKDFHNSNYFNQLAGNISSVVQSKILRDARKIDDHFRNLPIKNILADLITTDFNDSYYHQLAQVESLLIVTDDGDFGNIELNAPIITANRHLLRK